MAALLVHTVTHQCYFYVGAMETCFLQVFGWDRMKHTCNTSKCEMWESKIRIYWIGISSHMCHPVTKLSNSSHLESLLTFFYSRLYVLVFLHIVFPWIFIDIFIFEWRQNLMNVSWNVIISTLIMLWAAHMSQGMTLTTLLIYCQGLRMSGCTPICPICLHLVHRDNIASPCLIF